MAKNQKKVDRFHCEYSKQEHGYISGCGKRAAYNRFWKVCPYCGRRIRNLSNIYLEQGDKDAKEDKKSDR